MTDQKFDFRTQHDELSKAFGIDDTYTEDDFRNDIRNYAVLQFRKNPIKDGIISSYRNTVVFLKGNIAETVQEGEIWLCTLYMANNVYYAMPHMKITPAILMAFSTEIQDSIVDALWKTNKREYEKVFEERYRDKLKQEISEELSAQNSKEIESLQQRIQELENDLEASNYALDVAAGKVSEKDEIELSSEEMPEKISPAQPAVPDMTYQGPSSDWMPRSNMPFRDYADTFRMMHDGDMMRSARSMPVHAEHYGPKSIFSPALQDGRYYVHISPNKKYLLIRADTEGPIHCVNHQLMLEDLDRIMPFTERKDLQAEYMPKYKGIQIRLGI